VQCVYVIEVPTSVFGEHLRDQVENRLKFYETGEKPEKNADVMAKAEVEVSSRLVRLTCSAAFFYRYLI